MLRYILEYTRLSPPCSRRLRLPALQAAARGARPAAGTLALPGTDAVAEAQRPVRAGAAGRTRARSPNPHAYRYDQGNLDPLARSKLLLKP